MDRRIFLKTTLPAFALPWMSGGVGRAFGSSSNSAGAIGGGGTANGINRILVLIRLDGGNDGLNTVIPLDQYQNLAKARANILIPKEKILGLNEVTGLHPAMAGMQKLYQAGMLSVIQGVGYPNPNLSHFRSTDIWLSASGYNQVLASGWLGRLLEVWFPNFPEGYPNVDFPHPPAIQIGSVLSSVLQGEDGPLGMAMTNPNTSYNLVPGAIDTVSDTPAGHELTFIRQMAQQTEKYSEIIKSAAAAFPNKSALYPAANENRLADQLKLVARLIAGGLRSQVYVVSLGGFDTHSAQVDSTDSTLGRHQSLMKNLSTAITAFQDDLNLLGLEERVLGMTMSEFGRRIKSNASYGTDHGTSAPMFLFGKGVKGGIIGSSPEIPSVVTEKDNLPMQFDFRSVYVTVLKEWFGISAEESERVLMGEFPTLPAMATGIGAGGSPLISGMVLDQNYPNPFRHNSIIRFRMPYGASIRLNVHDITGRERSTLMSGAVAAGEHTVRLNGVGLGPGRYIYRLQAGNRMLQRAFQVLP